MLGNVQDVQMPGHGKRNLKHQAHTQLVRDGSPAASQSAVCWLSRQASTQTHSVCVCDVGVVERRQGRQLGVTGRVMGEGHDAIVSLDVAMVDGMGRVVLGGALKIALLFHLPPHGGVPVVLYCVVSPGRHISGL